VGGHGRRPLLQFGSDEQCRICRDDPGRQCPGSGFHRRDHRDLHKHHGGAGARGRGSGCGRLDPRGGGAPDGDLRDTGGDGASGAGRPACRALDGRLRGRSGAVSLPATGLSGGLFRQPLGHPGNRPEPGSPGGNCLGPGRPRPPGHRLRRAAELDPPSDWPAPLDCASRVSLGSWRLPSSAGAGLGRVRGALLPDLSADGGHLEHRQLHRVESSGGPGSRQLLGPGADCGRPLRDPQRPVNRLLDGLLGSRCPAGLGLDSLCRPPGHPVRV